MHTNTKPHPTSSKPSVSSFGENLACNIFKFILQPKSNKVVTHERAFAQIKIDKFWNCIRTHNSPPY